MKKKKKMHICLVNIEYPQETSIGGISTYQKLLADNLIKKGHKVTVIAGSFSDNKDYYDGGVHVIRIKCEFPFQSLSKFISYRKKVDKILSKLVDEEKIDIIETPEISADSIFYQKKRTIPIVVKLHTSYRIWKFYNNDINHFPVDINDYILNKEDELIYNADKIISCSNLLKELMPKFYKKLDINKIEVVPNPIDIDSFYPTKCNHNSKTILFCGSIEKRKGIYTLAKAIPYILNKCNDPSIKFRFIGNYKNIDQNGICGKEKIYKMIPKKYHHNIEFLGIVPYQKLNSYYNDAFVGIVGSLFDNFPYVALEQMLCELPIIASNNTGVKEMIVDKETGLLFDPLDYKQLANLIIYLLNNTNEAKKMGIKARKSIICKYNPDKIIDFNIDVYERTINEFNRTKK
ncbi:MAG: glycosyltransferase family 4 protein [Mollicutes bacterium]|nr:glycosyltransferase family 4 protein [Mollicutes bacterium]